MELGKGVLTNGTVHRLQHRTATDLHLVRNSVGKDALGDFVWVRPSQRVLAYSEPRHCCFKKRPTNRFEDLGKGFWNFWLVGMTTLCQIIQKITNPIIARVLKRFIGEWRGDD